MGDIRKVLYVTKNVYSYKQGNYYADWLEVFQDFTDVTIVEDINCEVELTQFDLIVFGHSFIDMIMKRLRFSNRRYVRGIRPLVMQEVKYIVFLSKLLNQIKRSNIKKIYFSKNDYKLINEKKFLSNWIGVDIFITHTKKSRDMFNKCGMKAKILWLPFAVSLTKYFQTRPKKYTIGMRANSNSDYNNGEREKLYKALKKIDTYKVDSDLHLCKDDKGSCFLHGDSYINWLSQCQLLVNTVSAYGTMGPKFLEGMACNTISIAYEDDYEGMLVADQHYLSIKKDHSNLESQLDRFFLDNEFRTFLIMEAKKFLENNNIEKQYEQLLCEFNS
jgi:hypothetical protein